MHGLARDDAGRLYLDEATLRALDRSLAVDRIAERVDDAAEQSLPDRHVDDGAGPLDDNAFPDLAVGAEDHDSEVTGLEIEGHALAPARDRAPPSVLSVAQPIDAGDAVPPTDRH